MSTASHKQRRRKRVLVVDDSLDMLTAVRLSLEPLGFDVLQTSNPFAGVRLAATHEPDAIVLDIDMPGMDGRETLRHLKRIEQTRDIPVIAFTGSSDDCLGCDDFECIVPKASGLETLEYEIEHILA